MRLLYLYTRFYGTQGFPSPYRGFPSWSINFSTDRHFDFDPGTGKLSEPQDGKFIPKVPKEFWGERIYNATAFVSSNGGGKSSIIQYLIVLLADLKQNLPNPKRTSKDDWVVVFGIGQDTVALQNKSILAQTPCPSICSGKGMICSVCGRRDDAVVSRIQQNLCHTKVIYLSNVLGKADEMFQAGWLIRGTDRTKRFLFDASICAMLYQAELDSITANNVVHTFFAQEQERMFRFLTSPEQRLLLRNLRKRDYPVPVPRKLTVYVNLINLFGAPDSLARWEQLNFPRSRENVWAPPDYTPDLRVERLIFELCCGASASCMKYIASFYDLPDWSSLTEKLSAAEGVPAPGGERGRVIREEFFALLDNMQTWVLKEHLPQKQARSAAREDKTILSWHIALCRDFIQFLCGKRTRAALSRYLPPPDLMDQRLRQLGEHIRLNFVVDLDAVLEEDANSGQSTWFMDFYQQYLQVCGSTPYLTLDWGLSSGEENLLKMFTNLQEVLCPAGRQGKILCNADDRVEDGILTCSSLWLFLDEADLTYHPEWQRQFMAILTAFLQEMYPEKICREMQIFLSTHSPLMLGDFPSRCVAYLRCRDEDGTKYVDDSGGVDTFGENLFSLLHSSFYLQKGEIGEIARQKIQRVIDFLTITREKLETGSMDDTSKEKACRELQRHRDETVCLLADGPIKTKLRMELNYLEERLISSESGRKYLIQALEAKLRCLRGEEGPGDDSDQTVL